MPHLARSSASRSTRSAGSRRRQPPLATAGLPVRRRPCARDHVHAAPDTNSATQLSRFGFRPRHSELWTIIPFNADPRRADSAAQASELVAACEAAWAAIQRHHAEVPDAVIVLGSGVERGRLVKLGHWWGGRWIADGAVRGEVLLAGEALHLAPEAVFEVLLHEAAHGLKRGATDPRLFTRRPLPQRPVQADSGRPWPRRRTGPTLRMGSDLARSRRTLAIRHRDRSSRRRDAHRAPGRGRHTNRREHRTRR